MPPACSSTATPATASTLESSYPSACSQPGLRRWRLGWGFGCLNPRKLLSFGMLAAGVGTLAFGLNFFIVWRSNPTTIKGESFNLWNPRLIRGPIKFVSPSQDQSFDSGKLDCGLQSCICANGSSLRHDAGGFHVGDTVVHSVRGEVGSGSADPTLIGDGMGECSAAVDCGMGSMARPYRNGAAGELVWDARKVFDNLPQRASSQAKGKGHVQYGSYLKDRPMYAGFPFRSFGRRGGHGRRRGGAQVQGLRVRKDIPRRQDGADSRSLSANKPRTILNSWNQASLTYGGEGGAWPELGHGLPATAEGKH